MSTRNAIVDWFCRLELNFVILVILSNSFFCNFPKSTLAQKLKKSLFAKRKLQASTWLNNLSLPAAASATFSTFAKVPPETEYTYRDCFLPIKSTKRRQSNYNTGIRGMLKIASPDCRYHVFRVAYKSGFVDFTQLAFKSIAPKKYTVQAHHKRLC